MIWPNGNPKPISPQNLFPSRLEQGLMHGLELAPCRRKCSVRWLSSPELALSHPHAQISHLLFIVSSHKQWLKFAGKGMEVIKIQASGDECHLLYSKKKIQKCLLRSRVLLLHVSQHQKDAQHRRASTKCEISGSTQVLWIRRIYILTSYFLCKRLVCTFKFEKYGLEISDGNQ